LNSISDTLIENPVIAAIRSEDDLKQVIQSRVKIVFVLYGSLLTLTDICKRLRDAFKTVFVHVDMIEGLKGDLAGINFIYRFAAPDGIVSTHVNIIKYAKQFHMKTILRVFLLDSLSLKTGIKNILETDPDAVEVMPGIACRIIHEMESKVSVPVIAGGLIINKEQVLESLSNGAIAISTNRAELWGL
jgi:glycerol uptake operon antiterminator